MVIMLKFILKKKSEMNCVLIPWKTLNSKLNAIYLRQKRFLPPLYPVTLNRHRKLFERECPRLSTPSPNTYRGELSPSQHVLMPKLAHFCYFFAVPTLLQQSL